MKKFSIIESVRTFKKIAPQMAWARIETVEARRMLSTTYYVSPTGSDSNAGTSTSTPWQTVDKVNASTFTAGDSILFQFGSRFHESLSASSSGTIAAPITYGGYGDATLANPIFVGSDVLNNAAFTLVTGTTYSMTSSTAVNWVYDNDTFLQESQDSLTLLGSSSAQDETTNINYVKTNSGFFYYDTATTKLYLNRGGSLDGHTIAASTRQDAIFSNQQSNLIFSHLDVTETAADNGGYGVRVQNSDNVQVLNSTASLTGKHAFGVIDSTGFVGQNLLADQSAPDQGFGGASAFVAYSDLHRSGDTSQWINATYTNAGGAYPVFDSHGDTGAIGSILLKNIVSLNGYGTGMTIESTSPTETVIILGGELQGSVLSLATSHSVIDGMRFDQGVGGIQLQGSADVVQNCVFTNLTPNVYAGQNGGVADSGTNNTIRFNTFSFTGGPGIDLLNPSTNTAIYANIFDCTQAIALSYLTNGMFTSNDNIFSPGTAFIYGGPTGGGQPTFAQWQALGYDTASIMADPGFMSKANANFQLNTTSPAIDFYPTTPSITNTPITTDFAGNTRPVGPAYDAGAYELNISVTGSVSVADTTLAAPLPGTSAPAQFTVTLSSAQTSTVLVHYNTVDGTAVGGTDYTATTGTLTFPAGVTSQTVNVGVSPTLGANSSKSFQLVIAPVGVGITLGTATATATVSNTNETTIAFNKKTPAIYTDAAGKKVNLKIGGVGNGTALFVSGNADPVQILITGTTRASTFSATSIGGVTTLQNIVIQGPIASITTTAGLTGSLEIAGTVARLTFGNLNSGASILLNAAGTRAAVKVGTATDATLTSASPISTLTAASWAGHITAPAISSISVKGAFGGDMNLTAGGIGLAAAKLGSISSGTWIIAGATSTVSTASITGLNATFTGGVKTILVTGAVTGASLRSGGNIAKISVGAAVNSNFFAGVISTFNGLPTVASDLSGSAQINSFAVTAARTASNAFSNSNVAAAKILTVKVQHVKTDNGGTAFGFAAQSLGAFTDVETGKKTFSWTARQNKSLLSFAGDFKVLLV